MTKRDWIISISAGLLVGILIANFGFLGGWEPMQATAAGDTDIYNVLSNVLNSHTKWTTAQGEAEIIWHGPDGATQRYVDRFEIAQPGSARFEIMDAPAGASTRLWISDGTNIFDVDALARTYTAGQLPNFATDLSVLPTTLEEIESETVYPHPFSMLIPSPVSEYIFPHWFVQGQPNASYQLLGEEEVIQRKTWLVDYKDDLQHHQLAWIDQQTGMILKFTHEIEGRAIVEFNMLSIIVNSSLDSTHFSVPADFSQVEVPEN